MEDELFSEMEIKTYIDDGIKFNRTPPDWTTVHKLLKDSNERHKDKIKDLKSEKDMKMLAWKREFEIREQFKKENEELKEELKIGNKITAKLSDEKTMLQSELSHYGNKYAKLVSENTDIKNENDLLKEEIKRIDDERLEALRYIAYLEMGSFDTEFRDNPKWDLKNRIKFVGFPQDKEESAENAESKK